MTGCEGGGVWGTGTSRNPEPGTAAVTGTCVIPVGLNSVSRKPRIWVKVAVVTATGTGPLPPRSTNHRDDSDRIAIAHSAANFPSSLTPTRENPIQVVWSPHASASICPASGNCRGSPVPVSEYRFPANEGNDIKPDQNKTRDLIFKKNNTLLTGTRLKRFESKMRGTDNLKQRSKVWDANPGTPRDLVLI
jgi:hypothetical protein